MKTFIIICLLLTAVLTANNIAQQDTARIKSNEKNRIEVKTEAGSDTIFREGEKIKEQMKQKEMKNIGDKSGLPLGNMKRKKDIFIDKDGDGICDPRVNGMGFDHLRKRYRMHQGGSGGSGGRGNGGSGGN